MVALHLERGNGVVSRLENGERVRLRRGETVTIQDVETTIPGNGGIVVNFKGFAGPNGPEDRGIPIHTGRDLMRQF